MAALAEIIRDLLIFIFVMFVLLVGLLVVVLKLPADHAVKKMLIALCWRIGATMGAGALAVPVEPIPGLDALYDVGVPVVLLLYWYGFIRDAYRGRFYRGRF